MHHSGEFFSGTREMVENGCVGELCSPGISLCGTGRSSTGKQGNAGEPVEHEHMAHFRIDGDCRRAVFPGEERGLRSYVIVPQVVVNDLEAPHELARGRA